MKFTALTDEQRRDFERDGYLVVRDALDEATVARLIAATDRICGPWNERGFWERRNCIEAADEFAELLDCPSTVPLITQILNHNIHLITSHLIVRPPTIGASSLALQSNWHRDGGTAPLDLDSELPRMFIKAAYWLTDVSTPGRGNLRVVPGSHLSRSNPPKTADGGLAGAVDVLAKAGDAVLFENRLWHAVGANASDVTRKAVFFGYGYRWLRPFDYVAAPAPLLERSDPICRQLLGEARRQHPPEPEPDRGDAPSLPLRR